jgi:hypothetical protein
MSDVNPNCDGAHCVESTGEVRLYALGGGGNLYLCRTCWAHENFYRKGRAREHLKLTLRQREPDFTYHQLKAEAEANWPQLDWYTAKSRDEAYE